MEIFNNIVFIGYLDGLKFKWVITFLNINSIDKCVRIKIELAIDLSFTYITIVK